MQSHRYNGKELDKMHGLNTYDYGARQYNPDVTKWINTLCAGDAGREIVSELFKAETGNLIVLGSECSNDYLTRTKLAKYREDGTVGKDENISNVITMAYDAPVEAGTHYSALGHEMAHAYDQLKNAIVYISIVTVTTD